MRSELGVALLLGAQTLGCSAPSAAEPGDTRAPLLRGEPVPAGAWPSVVSLDSGCTGTLIQPRVVLYAAHCGLDQRSAAFERRAVPILGCHAYPGGGVATGADLALCLLAEPVLDVPIVPIAGGCELDAVGPGSALTLVGYGAAEAGGAIGVKRELAAELVAVDPLRRELVVGGAGVGTCSGDSGGPAFVALEPGGVRRLIGVLSSGDAGTDCDASASYYGELRPFVPWLEQTAGVDLSPCFDGETWAPKPDCRDRTCGPPRAAAASDGAPPALDLLLHDLGDDRFSIEARIDDAGSGVRDVAFRLHGDDGFGQAILDGTPPYQLGPLPLPAQHYVVSASALDYAGNAAQRSLSFDTGGGRGPGEGGCSVQHGAPTAVWSFGALLISYHSCCSGSLNRHHSAL